MGVHIWAKAKLIYSRMMPLLHHFSIFDIGVNSIIVYTFRYYSINLCLISANPGKPVTIQNDIVPSNKIGADSNNQKYLPNTSSADKSNLIERNISNGHTDQAAPLVMAPTQTQSDQILHDNQPPWTFPTPTMYEKLRASPKSSEGVENLLSLSQIDQFKLSPTTNPRILSEESKFCLRFCNQTGKLKA